MSQGFIPGDIFVNELSLSSNRGSWDLTGIFLTASVYESIFTPCIMADIQVIDYDDMLGQIKIVGDETVSFSFNAPGGDPANYTFALHKLEDVSSTSAAQKTKTYTLKCVSEEAFHAKTNLVQKSYNTQISEMVKDIVQTYMHSSKNVDVEDTKGSQKIIIPSFNPLKSIDMIRRRAISDQNKSSTFLFFENRNGSDPQFIFKTIEELFQSSSVKSFQQSTAMNSSIYNSTDTNIISYEVPKQFNTIDRIAVGGKKRVANFNMRTHDYESKDTSPNPTSYKTGGSGSYDSADFKNKYIDQAQIPPQSVVPKDAGSGERPNTNIPEALADQHVFLSVLMQNAIKLRVTGDTKLTAGVVVTANIPIKSATTDNKENDKMLSGDFLVSRIHHQIASAYDRPRYTCVMELLKGNLEEGV